AGCSSMNRSVAVRPNTTPVAASTRTPTTTELVEYLNRNGKQIQSLECQDLDLDCKQRNQPVGLRGKMTCAKPRNFRMGASVVGSEGVALGSNAQEFWYWISKADPPYLFHCSYTDLARGQVNMPFPFQPEWVMEALGMGDYGRPENYGAVVEHQK